MVFCLHQSAEMRTFCLVNFYRKILRNAQLRRFSSTAEVREKQTIENIRNIGILAHIDAGKTTTTERMLFYSGTIRSMGEVHHGNTVTDYMEQERQRGITITSAAVSFPWNGSQINLIDTPGHIDFTMEVEQSLAVLDGAVVVLDASAGVEAQTITVWRQANGYRVPRLLYLNKMDRSDADATACAHAIADKLQAQPLLLHAPVRHEGKLIGLIDLVTLEEIIFTQGRGLKYTRRKLTEKEDGPIWENSSNDHRNIVDTLSSVDDQLADTIIKHNSLDNLNTNDILSAIRRSTIDMKLAPILCGSSYKNIGVQMLMDSIIEYLPSPLQCHDLYKVFDKDLAARAFKVQHDDQKGVLTFLRLYSGEISKGQKIYSLGQDKSDQSGMLYVALADEYQPVETVTAGNIAVVSGLKIENSLETILAGFIKAQTTKTGDLVTSTHAAATRAKERLSKQLSKPDSLERLALPAARTRLRAIETETAEDGDVDVAGILLGIGTTVPDPVFLCTIEPPSAAHQQALETALDELQREDPSLRVSTDEEAGQLVLAGMGELHLEIIKERIIREYNIDVSLGPLQIAYREALLGEARAWHTVDRKIGSYKQFVKIELSAKTVKGVAQDKTLRLDKSADSAANLAHVHPRQLNAIRQGVGTALMHGPKLGCKMVDVQVTLHWLEVGKSTSDSVLSSAVVQCLRKIFQEAGSTLLEPVMSLSVVVRETHAARAMADLTRRRVELKHVSMRKNEKEIECLAPLSELLGYATALRSLTSGFATFSMEFHSYRQMAPHDEEKAVRAITGF